MRKFLYTILLCLLCTTSFSQVWNNTGVATLQSSLQNGRYFYRNKTTTSPNGFVYWYTNNQVDSIALNLLPLGLQGQIIRNTADNTKRYASYDPLVYGNFIYTDAQLAKAESLGQATQLQIFNNFKRYSHGGTPPPGDPSGQLPTNNIPGQPSQTNSWSYDTLANKAKSTFNSGSAIGLVSRDKFDHYTHNVTLGASSADNDRVGVEIAFFEDPNDLVPNTAYGLNPADFNWPIDVVDSLIPNQHSLTLYRNRDDVTKSYFIVYDYFKLTQKIIANGSTLSGLFNTTSVWGTQNVDIQIVRTGDTIQVKTSNYSDAPGGKGSLAFAMTVNLNSDPILLKFKGKQAYGYSAQSQQDANYTNISFSGSNNVIYDLRNGNTYDFVSGSYVLNPDKNMYTDLGPRFFWRDTTQQTYGYVLPGNIYDVIVQPSSHVQLYGSASLNFPSTTAGSQSTLTISVPGATVGSAVTVGIPTSIVTGNYQFSGYVGAANVVSVTYQNLSGSTVDPSSGNFKVTVFE